MVNEALFHAVRFIETAPSGTDTKSAEAFCKDCGISKKALDILIKMPSPTDIGRLNQLMNAAEQKDKGKALKAWCENNA